MSALRKLRILDPQACAALHAEAMRDPRLVVKPRKPRKKPARPEAWMERRREYLEETGKMGKGEL